MNGDVVREWFDHLESLQRFVLTFSTTVRGDLYEFSRQTLAALIGNSPLRQNGLVRHCQVHSIGFCRPQTFASLGKTFREFLDEIGMPIQEVLIYRCFDIARKDFAPPWERRLVAEFRAERVERVCAEPADQQVLLDRLFPDVRPEFLAGKGNLVYEAVKHGWTFDELCQEIVR